MIWNFNLCYVEVFTSWYNGGQDWQPHWFKPLKRKRYTNITGYERHFFVPFTVFVICGLQRDSSLWAPCYYRMLYQLSHRVLMFRTGQMCAHLHSCASSRDHNSPIMIFYSFRVILLCFILANHSHSFVYVSHAFTILKKFVVMFCRHGPPHTVSRKIYYEISRI